MTEQHDLVARLRGLQTTCPTLHNTFSAAASHIEALESRERVLCEAIASALKRLEKGAPGWGVAKDELRRALAGDAP